MNDLPFDIDTQGIKEDARKVGLVIAATGVGGLIITSNKITSAEGWSLLVIGVIIWVFGVIVTKGDTE